MTPEEQKQLLVEIIKSLLDAISGLRPIPSSGYDWDTEKIRERIAKYETEASA